MKPDKSKPVPHQLTPTAANALVESGSAVIFDVREHREFLEEHISGAQSLPMSELSPQQLPVGKTAILYCGLGKRSCAAAEKLVEAGFGKVAVIEGGIVGWKQSGLATDGENSR
jgi:rhodanese-related sulfurtransferase